MHRKERFNGFDYAQKEEFLLRKGWEVKSKQLQGILTLRKKREQNDFMKKIGLIPTWQSLRIYRVILTALVFTS